MKRLRKEIVQAVGASEPFPIFHPLWRLAKIGLDWAPPRLRTGWLFGRVAIAGQSCLQAARKDVPGAGGGRPGVMELPLLHRLWVAGASPPSLLFP